MSDQNSSIQCDTHAETDATFVCQHLLKGEKLGFNIGFDPGLPDDLWPDAWCDQCEKVFLKEGEWNELSEKFSPIKLLCTRCYETVRAKNWHEDEKIITDLIISSFHYLQGKQEFFSKKFKINEHEQWDWYQETGKLIFSHNGKPQVEAVIHFAGSYSTTSETWMWAWANQHLDEKVTSASKRLKTIGDEQQLQKLASGRWEATEVDGWGMTAILAKELSSIGAYRTPSDNGFAYMVIEKAKWVK